MFEACTALFEKPALAGLGSVTWTQWDDETRVDCLDTLSVVFEVDQAEDIGMIHGVVSE